MPESYKHLFAQYPDVLLTHRGYDIGALELAKWLADECKSPLIFSTTTRLLVELNRSLHSRSLFSSFSEVLSRKEKEAVLRLFYFPYREKVTEYIKNCLQNDKKVLHLSIHSFTPILHGKKRKADMAFLYDSQRKLEKEICHTIGEKMASPLVIRYNYPYKGSADGLTTSLRQAFPKSKYLGIEIEMNQSYGVKPLEGVKKELFEPLLRGIKVAIGEE